MRGVLQIQGQPCLENVRPARIHSETPSQKIFIINLTMPADKLMQADFSFFAQWQVFRQW